MELSRLQNLILYILIKTEEKDIKNLSKYQIMKLIYLVEVESHRFLGESFIGESQIKFYRESRGPVSRNIYDALRELDGKYIDISIESVKGYSQPRHSHSLKKDIDVSLNFSDEK